MKIAIMSDVHSNPMALETALADAARFGCGRYLMLGDVTGYGYDVRSAIALVRSRFDAVLIGNHDSACLGREPQRILELCRNYDLDVAQGRILGEKDRRWLGSLPYVVAEEGAAFAHGFFVDPEAWDYVTDPESALVNFRAREERLLFCGHTHFAETWELTTKGVCRAKGLFGRPATRAESKSFKPRRGFRYIVNVGSVGYPRNDLCSTYVIWDTETDRITYRRLPFDFKNYIEAMVSRRVPLPNWLVRLLMAAR